jgi:WD40 repeat protein/transcriptional regulator with XRE-family HTH domain
MKRFSYREHNYDFGQRMLTLRNAIGLTQAGLAELLGISRRAVAEWESGRSYPKVQHLQHLLTLAVQTSAFPKGHEVDEIQALWKAAHQKVLLDESRLSSLLNQPPPLAAPVSVEGSSRAEEGSSPAASPTDRALAAQSGQPLASPESLTNKAPAALGPRVDWGEALDVPSFYGRERELTTLTQWMVQEHCRVVSVLGLGGIGKSALATCAMRLAAEHFQVVLFRSLRDAPSCEALLAECLQVLAPQQLEVGVAVLERRISLLLEELRKQRVLLVLDNLENLLQAGVAGGHLRPGYEGYHRLLQVVAERAHQSCLLLTSREKPTVLGPLESRKMAVRSLRLGGLEAAACEQILAIHELLGSPEERARLIALYEGNPLALNMVAETIADLFGGQITPFLVQDTLVFGSISDLLDEQVGRLSELGQTLLFWLAILREPVTLQELQAALVVPLVPVQVLEAVDGLYRRNLVERGQRAGSFTLQSVVLEYVTGKLVSTMSQEIQQGQLLRLREQSLSQAQAKEYVRQAQERLLLTPLLDLLQSTYRGRAEMQERLHELLDALRAQAEQTQGYGPANLVTLLRLLRGNLRGLDLSRLVLRGVHLQGVEMQDANLSEALLQECVFTQTFDAITGVAISRSGQYWAAVSRRGEVRVWEWEQTAGPILREVWQAHTETTYALAFSPNGRLLATGSWDDTLKLWDLERSAPRWLGWHPQGIESLAIVPDGSLLATGGNDATVRLWDLERGTQMQLLPHPSMVLSLTWSPDGRWLASGDIDGQIRLWEMGQSKRATSVQTLVGHTNYVLGLAFAPDGRTLASVGGDRTVKLWDVGKEGSLSLRQTFTGHTDLVFTVAWSPDGLLLASGGRDHTIWLWDLERRCSWKTLSGHTAMVYGLAFIPDSHSLLSGSEDGTLRMWDVEHGEPLRILRGYADSFFDVDWSPDGTRIASVGSDTAVIIWEVERPTPSDVLRGHRRSVYAVAWSPDGHWLASSGWDQTTRLWDTTSWTCLEVFQNPNIVSRGIAWSPDGHWLACGTYSRGVQMWDMTTRSRCWAEQQLLTWVYRLAWSPDGAWLVGGGNDGQVYVWEAKDGTLLQQLAGHHGAVTDVAWSPDSTRLVSASSSKGNGELVVWDVQNWQPIRALGQQTGVICGVAWSPDGKRLVSGGSDGRLRWWDIGSGECVWIREAHQGTVQALKVSPDGRRLASCGDDGAVHIWDGGSGEHLRTLRRDRPYERLTITGIRGLTEAQKTTLRGLGAVEDGRAPAER